MFKYITNITSGKSRHWNESYLPHFHHLNQKAMKLPEDVSSFFVDINKHAKHVSGLILGYSTIPDTDHLRIINKDLKTITSNQFKLGHNTIIWALIATIALCRHHKKNEIIPYGKVFIDIRPNETKFVGEIINLASPEFNEIARIVYPELSAVFEYNDHGSAFFKAATLSATLTITTSIILKGYEQ